MPGKDSKRSELREVSTKLQREKIHAQKRGILFKAENENPKFNIKTPKTPSKRKAKDAMRFELEEMTSSNRFKTNSDVAVNVASTAAATAGLQVIIPCKNIQVSVYLLFFKCLKYSFLYIYNYVPTFISCPPCSSAMSFETNKLLDRSAFRQLQKCFTCD